MDQGHYYIGPLYVGDGTWLGAGVSALDGIRVGRGCIVGAGAVVTRDLPENLLAGGVPAKVLRQRNNPENLLFKD
jgi:acetyltransferase-like isoleucine patch superfamily enzyme